MLCLFRSDQDGASKCAAGKEVYALLQSEVIACRKQSVAAADIGILNLRYGGVKVPLTKVSQVEILCSFHEFAEITWGVIGCEELTHDVSRGSRRQASCLIPNQ